MVQVEREFRYWKERAERFEDLYDLRRIGIEKILCESYPYLKNVEGYTVDVGCGTGIPSYMLEKKLGKNVIGTDFSPSMLKTALLRERIRNVVQADALHLTFPKESLGAIVCVTVLTDYRDKEPFYHEFYSCIRKDGIYVHGDYSLNDGYWNLNEHTYPLAFSSEFKLSRESIEYIEEKLVEVGFGVLKSKSIDFDVQMTVDDYLDIVRSRPGFKFDTKKEDQVRRIADEYLLNNKLGRELILIIGKKRRR